MQQEETHHLLDFQKLFRDVPSTIELERNILPAQEISAHMFEEASEVTEKKEQPLTINGDISESTKEIEKLTLSATVPRDQHPSEIEAVEEKTHRKLGLFEESLNKFPLLMRQFYSIVPKTTEDGGLSVTDQGRVIHFGIKLETKVLELIDQYNSFIKDMG